MVEIFGYVRLKQLVHAQTPYFDRNLSGYGLDISILVLFFLREG